MFNRSEIMKRAWQDYKARYGNRPFKRSLFTWCLQIVWAELKQAIAYRVNPVAAKIADLRHEAEMLSYKPWRIDIMNRQREIEGQIASLLAA
ncbi:hypothetical protein [Phyllobacterium leguminum]|uniref:Uncharacterized protein n=1 Tax=Phyllobacterium leguminum TaxID=314237 RepID=A0A318TCD6_9HYPH|nr:hypothetical protein [Phyllobacterium leguminum]PYE88762.1 hypothetical protein C7477_106135 [Phyllobacterium leguminum]